MRRCGQLRRTRVVLIAVTALGLAHPCHASDAKHPSKEPACREEGGARELVLALHARWGPGAVQNEGRAVLERYFDDALTSLLLKDRECVRREGGKCNLTASILFWAQDTEISDLRICALGSRGDEVEARFRNFGVAQAHTYAMRNTERGWRIVDVRYADGSSLRAVLERPR